ncbi:Smr/MutS family protein [Actibacterium lipolyticum]|uniref:Smr domain-containing protein n=1 Tax=Actibacterium lipolyticum TaxID=1524263 RepID=A0A238KY57_9RHOB|nr:Smr/MutS family protein [Actibacterium lipolyticum]SMX47132.1 hypothetical protein COL8621_03347 [Actibacterium lipolyticum]
MRRRPPRGLSPEENALWQKVTETAVPMHADHPKKPKLDESSVKPKPKPKPKTRTEISGFRLGQKAADHPLPHDLALGPAEALGRAPVHMDRKSYGRMKRGKLSPEGRIDLHGMTLSQAHPALTSFILQSHAAGKRLVLVITGKGKRGEDTGPMPVRRGILKHQVPHWLNSPPLGSVVLQVSPAHQKHGGGGAYYVYLRRQR